MRLTFSLILCCPFVCLLNAQKPDVPDWAKPGSATHVQVAPPTDFHRPPKTYVEPIGLFDGQ